MIYSIRSKVGNDKFVTHYRCQEQTDAIWISKDLEATKVTVFPIFINIYDHKGFLMNVLEELILGNKITKIQQPYARRLICWKKGVQKKYIKELEYPITYHKLVEKIEYIKNNKANNLKETTMKMLNKLDKEKNKSNGKNRI